MSVFRVEKNKGYTVMSNHHIRNHTLSLKAKGLLSQMLSLPDDWDYTLQGLAQINKESIDAIREAVRELERAGYIKRSRERDERGCLRGTVYTIYEQPHAEPTPEEPTQEKPALDNPTLEKPMLGLPTLENPTQLNTESTKKRKRQSKDSSITDSIPFPSGFPESPTQKRTETKGTFESYRELILENIDYDVLASDPHVDQEQLDEIVETSLKRAAIWEETLPLGNGRLGMMPDGGILREHIVLNEISLWSGMEADYSNPDASKSLPAIRQLLFEGKNREAQELMYSSFVPKKQETDGRYGTYQVLGDLDIDFTYNSSLSILNSPLNNYRRWLNLRDAVAYTAFRLEDVDYRREYFVSRDRDVMLIHLVAGHEGALNFLSLIHI